MDKNIGRTWQSLRGLRTVHSFEADIGCYSVGTENHTFAMLIEPARLERVIEADEADVWLRTQQEESHD